MSIDSTLKYIHSVSWKGSRLGLERIRELMALLGNPEKELKFVHVAGTNGKGSTCAYIASVLTKAGYKTGLFTSPFIMKFNERIQIDGRYISDEELEEFTERVRPFAESMEDSPTEFELITGIAFEYFRSMGCDIVVLEVGMGGELDSTNVIPKPEIEIITSIGMDHMAQLGSTIGEIAKAKAGIIKPDSDVVISGGNQIADEVIENTCRKRNCRLTKVDMSKLKTRSADLDGICFDYDEHKNINISLVGTYQPVNGATALLALEVLQQKGWNISEDAIRDGFKNVVWPGRFELLHRDPTMILDGAHNTHGMKATVESLKTYFPDSKGVFLMGAMADKDISSMLSLLIPIADNIVTVRPDNPRAMSPDELAGLAVRLGGKAESAPSIEEGLRRVIALCDEGSYICALGSLYFSTDVRRTAEKLFNL